MSKRATLALVLLSHFVVAVTPPAAYAQVWSLDVSGGRTVYEPLPVNVSTNNLVGSVRYDARRGEWVYVTAALPLGDQASFWDGVGAGGTFSRPATRVPHLSFGADLDAHGFIFRDAAVQQYGSGTIFEGVPFARLSRDAASVEVRGGWRGHSLSFAGTTQTRGVFETGIRGAYGDATVGLRGDLRWVHATEGVFPFIGGSIVVANSSPVGVWASVGKWLGNGLTNSSWGIGGSIAVTGRSTVWASAQQDAPDPLFWNAQRRSWAVGVTRRLTRGPAPIVPAPAAQPGGVLIRVRAADTPGGDVFIAGSFNNWQPQPMRREGDEWIVSLPLAAGVYHYSFRSSTGEWFVPASTPGRRDDGMGGNEAVLVVS